MRHAGAIRIDHAFQLQRLFLIPPGASAAQGAYVDYPFAALLAVLRLESHRARALVIAEDLGTAPEGFSDAIMAAGVLSYRVLSFEREADGAFKRPDTYPRSAMAVVSTHDLPTFRGWWRGLDIDLRQTSGVFDPEVSERERATREVERAQLAQALAAEGLLASGDLPDQPPLIETARYLARTASSLAALQLEDAAGELNQANMPGLDAGHPNWRRRLSTDLATLVAPGGDLARLASAMATEGRGIRPASSALASPPPRATYRLQFHKEFTFDDAARAAPYLARLGVSHLYASPIQKARPGSTHGYDIVDHAEINPELGGEEGFHPPLEHPQGARDRPDPRHRAQSHGGGRRGQRVVALDAGVGRAVGALQGLRHRLGAARREPQAGPSVPRRALWRRARERQPETRLRCGRRRFSVWHWEHRFPITPTTTYPLVLDRALAALGDFTLEAHGEILAISARLRAMGEEPLPERRAAFRRRPRG
jgi:(1->4)-alpha-D-glucan 1-alpha-D-glucosylmutase